MYTNNKKEHRIYDFKKLIHFGQNNKFQIISANNFFIFIIKNGVHWMRVVSVCFCFCFFFNCKRQHQPYIHFINTLDAAFGSPHNVHIHLNVKYVFFCLICIRYEREMIAKKHLWLENDKMDEKKNDNRSSSRSSNTSHLSFMLKFGIEKKKTCFAIFADKTQLYVLGACRDHVCAVRI